MDIKLLYGQSTQVWVLRIVFYIERNTRAYEESKTDEGKLKMFRILSHPCDYKL